MIEEKDFILREIQRITLLLKRLISNVTGLEGENTAITISEIDQTLKSEFDLSLKEISVLSNEDFLKRIEGLNEIHIEHLTVLIFEVLKNNKDNATTLSFDEQALVRKNILMINLLDEKSKIFSLQRMNMKSSLQEWL